MKMFYSAFIESTITFSIMCWYGNLSARNKNALTNIVKIASKVTGVQLGSLEDIYCSRIRAKANKIRYDDSHPLYSEYKLLPLGHRLAVPRASRNRYRLSF